LDSSGALGCRLHPDVEVNAADGSMCPRSYQRITAIIREEDIVAVCLHFASIETDHSVAVCWEEAE